MRLDARQRAALVRLVEGTPTGDIEQALIGVEIALTIAMEATRDDLALWEAEGEATGYQDEFSVSNEDVACMPIQWRLAYVARLLRTIALHFGTGTEFGGKVGARRDDRGALAPLLRSLTELVADPNALDDLLSELDDLMRAERQAETRLAEIRRLARAHQGSQA